MAAGNKQLFRSKMADAMMHLRAHAEVMHTKLMTLPDTALPMYLDEMCLIVKKKKTGGGGIAAEDACFHGISLLGLMAHFAKVGSCQVLLHMSKRHTTLLWYPVPTCHTHVRRCMQQPTRRPKLRHAGQQRHFAPG